MRVFAAISMMTVLLVLSCVQMVWSQGGFVERASVFVTADSLCIGKSPWLKPADRNSSPALNKGWAALTAASTTHLASGAKIECYISAYGDHRGRETGKPTTKVEGKRIVISISEQFKGGPKTPVYEPSLWCERVTLANLGKGVYEVYLHSTLAGRISIP
jgi:hypothetical protein